MGRKSEITIPHKYDENKSWTIIQTDSGAYLLQENLITKKYTPSEEGRLTEHQDISQWGNKVRLSLDKIANITEFEKAEIKKALKGNEKNNPYSR